MTSTKIQALRWRVSAAILVALLATLGLLCLFSTSEADDDGPSLPDPVVGRADQEGIVLEWRAPEFTLSRDSGEDGRPYTIVEAPGWGQSETPGHPQLPLASALAVAPPTGDVTLHVQALEREQRTLSHPVMPAPRMEAVGEPPVGLEPAWARDERAYARSGSPTMDVVALEEAGWIRGRRLVRLTFRPVRYDPAKEALEIARRVRVKLRFTDRAAAATGWAADDALTPILQRAVINPEQVVPFARPGRRATASPTANRRALSARFAPTDTEYLIITHSDFITAVAPLAQHRAISDGLQVFSTTTQAIYDAYSGGEVSAPAIRDYISEIYHAPLSPALNYVLLVGDGSEMITDTQYVPPYMISITPSWYSGTLTATADNRFVTVDGPDQIADVFIGRLPVNSPAEAEIVVEKIISYESNPPRWPWNERALFFADDPADGAYHAYSDEGYDMLAEEFTGRRVYYCTSGCEASHLYDDIEAARVATMETLDGGGLLASYFGHSSWHRWAVENLFHLRASENATSNVESLRNGGALPVFLQMTCLTGYFAYPGDDTLDESLLRHPCGGAVATCGSTTLACTSGQHTLHQRFLYAVFEEDMTRLGPIITYAKSGLSSSQYDLRDTFVLLGDPAMDLNMDIVPWSDELFLPLVMRSS